MSSVWETLGRALSPVEERPRVAAGLESACYRTRSGAEYVVVHNPARRTYARLDPREFDLLPLMDGQHSVKELVIAYYQRCGVLAMARVAGLVRLLRQQRFLVEGSLDVYSALAARLRRDCSQRQPLALAKTSAAFDRFLGDAYLAWGHLFFHPAWLAIGVALGVRGAAFVLLVDNLFISNPPLALDGYYMLIDVLDRPLLRAQSLAFVRGPLWSRLWRRERVSSEERLFAGFGLGAILYGVAAVLLAIHAWQALLVPLVATSLQSGDPIRQVGGVVILAAVGASLLLAGAALVQNALGPAGDWLARLGGRAAEHRHREALAALRAVPLWSEVPAARLLEIARAMRAEDVPPGEEVVRQGEQGDRFYLISYGAFEVQVDRKPQVRLG